MRHLLFKEFRLSISPVFFLLPLLAGGLMLIPQWVYFIALMYFYWIALPNIFATYNTQNDLVFSVFMPVEKKDVVKSKVAAISIMEVVNIAVAALFAMIHHQLYGSDNFLLDLNMAFFGFAFMMNGIFNIILFPMFFKTGYKYGIPIIIATIGVILFTTAVEFSLIISPVIKMVLEAESYRLQQFIILLSGIALFILLSFIAYKLSAKKFNLVEL